MPGKRKHGPLAPVAAGGRPGDTVDANDIPEARRRAIYVALGEARAAGLAVEAARYAVAKKYVVTIMKVEAIEQEGFAEKWPTAN